MKQLDGMMLPSFPIPELRHVRDLVFYDGPLLSHYEHANGDDYLYYWCDCDDVANRWMVFRVNEADILRLVNRYVPIDFVIPKGSRDGFVYLVDIADNGAVSQVHIVTPDKLPSDYKPKAGTYLQVTRNLHSDNSYNVLVNGGWSVENLGEFPRKFGKVYSLLYGLNVLHTSFDSLPWRGGFSSMHFFDRASRSIPKEHKPSVSAIQYASPGFMRFALHVPTAMQVTQCLIEYKTKNTTLAPAYALLRQYIRDNKLNEIMSDDDPAWPMHEPELKRLTLALVKEFTTIDETDFLRACPRPFEAAKIASTFYGYIRELVDFEKEDRVLYPKFG